MKTITGIGPKRTAVHHALLALEETELDAVKSLEHVMGQVGITGLVAAVDALGDITESTGADGFEIANVLALMRAREHGEVLYPEAVDVHVIDQDGGEEYVDAGVLVKQGQILSVHLVNRDISHVVAGRDTLRAWQTTAGELAAYVARLVITIWEGGQTNAEIINVRERELNECESMSEFAAA